MSGPVRWRTWDDYWQPGTTDVLRNRFGITDAGELERVERVHSLQRIWELERSPVPGGYDLAHLQAIHERIFGDVYEWAGVIREFTLVKGGDEFCRPQFIESAAGDIFDRLHRADLLRGLDVETFALRSAELLGDVNALHPFREGNGRTQRAFLSQLASEAGHPLVWPSGAALEQRNVDASRAAHQGDMRGLAELIRDALAAPTPRTTTGKSSHPR